VNLLLPEIEARARNAARTDVWPFFRTCHATTARLRSGVDGMSPVGADLSLRAKVKKV
jgi:hypothetical protein